MTTTTRNGIIAGGAAMVFAALAVNANAQNNDVNAALNACRNEATSRLRVGRGNVEVERGNVDRNGNLVVRFRARRGNQWSVNGACAVSPSIQIVRFRSNDNNNNNSGWNDNTGNWGDRTSDNSGWGNTNRGWGSSGNNRQSDPWSQDSNRPVVNNFHQVRVDTSGRGSFNGGNLGSVQITRGWVDTRSGRPAVGVSGKDNFKVMFYGDIIEANDRRMVMRITSSDRGNATGRAEFELNKDRNEVQFINLQGRLGNQQFTGAFTR